MRQQVRWIGVLALIFSTLVLAESKGMVVEEPYVRATMPGIKHTAAYMTLQNHYKKPIALLRAKTPVAEIVELHSHEVVNGVMQMRKVPRINVKANEEVVLEPGSYHIMMRNLNRPLKEDTTIPITLYFSNNTRQVLTVPVRGIITQ